MPRKSSKPTPIYERPLELLQNLIRFDTTNPPGDERPLIEYVNGLLKEAGIKTNIVAREKNRPNLIARIKGEGKVPPLLLYAHVDVVTTVNQKWTHPPFEGVIADGFLWGRGALDNKHAVAMYLAAFLKARAEGIRLPGDVIFAATADEEAGCQNGAKFLVEEHADLFKGVRYALSEFGGTTATIMGKRFYPIQNAEKQASLVRVTFHGEGGHGAVPVRSGAMAKLGAALRTINRRKLPLHITPETRMMIEAFAKGLGGVKGAVVALMMHPLFSDLVLKAFGPNQKAFSPLLRNSISPTMVVASDKLNVIPSEVTLGLDGRLLPGYTAADIEKEVRALLGNDCKVEVVLPFPGPTTTDMGLFETLADTLRELDPLGIPFPFVNFGATDARFFSRLGIQTYGFTPLELPEGLPLTSIIHAADERIPVGALDFGMQAMLKVLQRFH